MMPTVDDVAFTPLDTGRMDGNEGAGVPHLLKVSVDDFIQMAQTTNMNTLCHLRRALLHGVHNVFPPLEVTGHLGQDPVLLKKLMYGNRIWDVCTGILGWMLNGALRCIKITVGQ